MTKNQEFIGFTISEVADLFGVSVSTIYRWIKQEVFPKGKKAPGGRRWSIETIQYYLDVNEPTQNDIRNAAKSARMVRGAA